MSFLYRNVDYLNAKASFVDLHTLEAETNDGKVMIVLFGPVFN